MDPAARRSLAAAVQTLTAGGSAVVLATHDAELAADLADRTIELHGGRATERAPEVTPGCATDQGRATDPGCATEPGRATEHPPAPPVGGSR
jgi:energy-coupling factor transporter ATP-binding protein EcfA2